MMRNDNMARRCSLILGLTILGVLGGSANATGTEVSTGSADPLASFIDEQIRQTWADNEVQPSPSADDAEWLRRVSLDIVGRIPAATEVTEFLEDEDPGKRAHKIDELLDHPDYVRHFTEHWTNQLIGRNTPRRTSRSGMRKFLRDAFTRNRPWNEIVYDLVTAEGHYEENGAVNFMLAQLDGNPRREDYHVQATAKVTRIFLGMQVQCTQCHNHPFNEWKQNQFWEFNSFFRQVRRVDHRTLDPESGRRVDDYSELVYQPYDEPVYFEMRNGLIQVAYPKYLSGEEIDPKTQDRRQELARLMCFDAPEQMVAKAFVNRTWADFLGYGFTRPLDDMGPHNPPSHPELLARLSDEFVKSGYDVKQLIRWICNTEVYNLTSRILPENEFDNPAAGEVPLFSHMYVKTLQAEQLYDSLILATNTHQIRVRNDAGTQNQKERWMRDFLRIFGGNEEDEPTLFSGSIPQALLMMNGPLVQNATSAKPGSYLRTVLASGRLRSDSARVQALFVSSLGRKPTRLEITKINQIMNSTSDKLAAYQDLYWALLNSNEFILNH